jgi:hypothetical protein
MLNKVQDILQEKLSKIKCQSGNLEVQWNNIKKCVLDSMSDLVGKDDRKARKPWITHEIINQMDERMKWKNVNNEERRMNYRRLTNESKKPQTRPRRSILRAYVMRPQNFKEHDVVI